MLTYDAMVEGIYESLMSITGSANCIVCASVSKPFQNTKAGLSIN